MAEAKQPSTEEKQEKVLKKIEEPVKKETSSTAKAGKRSAKAVAETEKKQAKEERKKVPQPEESKPKHSQKPPRSKAERKGRKYQKNAQLIDKAKAYKVEEALELACKTSSTKFDSSVEIHLRLNVDPKQADQNIRDSIVLPSGTGKTVRVAVFADEVNAKKAKTAGADVAGEEDFLKQLDKGMLDFDVLISMPNMMAKLAKYAKILGPKGLMPNPKSGTVTTDVAKAVEQSKAGKIEYRVDGSGIIHCSIGKVSFGPAKLKKNADALIGSIKSNKPASIKGTFVRTVFITTTMGPSVPVETGDL